MSHLGKKIWHKSCSSPQVIMHFYRFLRGLSEDRNTKSQVVTGLLLSGLSIGVTLPFWPETLQAPFSTLVLPVLAAYTFGGGSLAGGLASLVVVIYGMRFIPFYGWTSFLAFSSVLLVLAWLVSNTKRKIAILSAAQVKAEEAIRLKFASAAGKLGVWEWDVVEDNVVWDDRMLEIFGLEKSQFTGSLKDWHRSLYPADCEQAIQALDQALKTGGNFENEFRIQRPGGEVRNLHSQGLIIRNESGQPIKMFGLVRDLTEEKKAAKKIQELNAYLEVALEQSQAGIVIVEAGTGALRFANNAALKISGRPKEQLLENIEISTYPRWHVADLEGNLLKGEDYPGAKCLQSGEFITEQLSIIHQSGERRFIHTSAAPIRGSDGSIIAAIVILIDTTEQHQLVQELQSAKKQAEEAMLAKARFLDVAAHELRTPVTAASLLLQLAHRETKKGIALNVSVINRIKVQIDRLSRLVVDLLEVSKLDRGVLELRNEWTDLGELTKECISNFQIQFPERSIKLVMEEEPMLEKIDPTRIYEVISNLLDNSIKYSPENAPISITWKKQPDKIHFSITDQGKGMSEQLQHRLFCAFERENGDSHQRYSGLGLGLFISKGIIELHGGVIGLEKSGLDGSTFFFEIPRTQIQEKTGTD